MSDHLEAILARKRLEVARRARRRLEVARRAGTRPEVARRVGEPTAEGAGDRGVDRGPAAIAALRREGAPLPRVIAEIKRRSPSAGTLRARAVGDVAAIARAYEEAGAAAISVLADGPGFGGSALDVRRAARAVSRPILFKEFVIDPIQIDLARATGASLVLLLVRALDDRALASMIRAVRDRGMEPIVEAADAPELARALATDATIVGVNARDLRRFTVDPAAAAAALQEVPKDRVAVYMSGVGDRERLAEIAKGRADAVLIGTELMRAPDPGARLRDLLRIAD